VELPYLVALITPTSPVIPHFLTPTPLTNSLSIEDDLAELMATPGDLIRKYMLELIAEDGDSEMRQFFIVHPREAIQRLAEELQLYWQRALARYRAQMASIKDGDVLYRARILALKGAGAMFEELHPAFGYRNNAIQIRRSPGSRYCPIEFELNGQGLQLAPGVFSSECRLQIVPEWPPRISYPVRGGGLWGQRPPDLRWARGAPVCCKR
jgi:hypothetical protein